MIWLEMALACLAAYVLSAVDATVAAVVWYAKAVKSIFDWLCKLSG